MDNEINEIGKAIDEESKRKRASNRESSAEILKRNGIKFESNNNGVHLIIKRNMTVVDFWPGTGKYRIRNTGATGRGVFNLLRVIKGE